jgi:hypothetical protein
MSLETPKRAPVRPLADLAEPLGCTKAAIYAAAHRGDIGGVIRTGSHLKIRLAAFDYHAEQGYGPGILPFGATAASEAVAA